MLLSTERLPHSFPKDGRRGGILASPCPPDYEGKVRGQCGGYPLPIAERRANVVGAQREEKP